MSTTALAGRSTEVRTRSHAHSRLRDYLRRDVARGARFLDHGIVGLSAAGGIPHRYRLALELGIFDHLTIGVTSHWLTGQSTPGWSPTAALALWRARLLEAGVWYHETLHPPPRTDDDPMTPDFQERTHWLLSSVTFSQWGASAGLDLGWVRGRVRDPIAGASDEPTTRFVVRDRVGGGVHVRLGTRRWGLTFQGLWPYLELEARFDLRFGLFEMRRRGGWWPGEWAPAKPELEIY